MLLSYVITTLKIKELENAFGVDFHAFVVTPRTPIECAEASSTSLLFLTKEVGLPCLNSLSAAVSRSLLRVSKRGVTVHAYGFSGGSGVCAYSTVVVV